MSNNRGPCPHNSAILAADTRKKVENQGFPVGGAPNICAINNHMRYPSSADLAACSNGARTIGPVSFRRAAFVYWFSLLMFACTYLARSTSTAYVVALSALCLGFATFVHFIVLCHPLARTTASTDVEQFARQTDGANLESTEECLFMHACLMANLRAAQILLRAGTVRKGYAAFVIRYLWRLGTVKEASSSNASVVPSVNATGHTHGTEPDHKGCAVAIFELAHAAFPDFVSVCREDPWPEIMLAWACDSYSRPE